jgi:hemolysin activation/secretion protein
MMGRSKVVTRAVRCFLLVLLLGVFGWGASINLAQAAESQFSIATIELRGNFMMAEEVLQKEVQEYLGSNKTVQDLEKIQNAVFSAYKRAGYTLVSIVIAEPPDQNGRLTVIIKEDILRSVKITGNKYLKEEQIRQALPALKTGQAINTRALDRQILVANENASRVISVALQTIDVGVFDAIVTVKEGKIITQSLSLDNTGNRSQDPLRMQYRFIHYGLGAARNATGVLIYSRSPRNTVQQYLAYYQQPISALGNSWYAMAAYSNSKTGLSDSGYGVFNVAGSGQFYSLHYVHPLQRSLQTKFALDVGLEYRNSTDNTSIYNIDVGPDVISIPLSISAVYSWDKKRDSLSTTISYVRNLPGGYLNDDDAYGRVRLNAKSAYQLWRGNFSYIHRFKTGWIFHNRLDWQYTTQPLIPDEQFGLGGARSIRGFEERELLGEKGISASFELYTPPLSPGLRLVLFYDIGQIWQFDAYRELTGPATLASIGVGMRWLINSWLSFNADYAYIIKGFISADFDRYKLHDSRIHFDLTATF